MTKGNDGSATRRRSMRKLLIAAGLAVVIVFIIVCYDGSESSARKMTDIMSSHSHQNKRNHGGDMYYDEAQGRPHDRDGRRNMQLAEGFHFDEEESRHGRGGHRYGRAGAEYESNDDGRDRGRGRGRGFQNREARGYHGRWDAGGDTGGYDVAKSKTAKWAHEGYRKEHYRSRIQEESEDLSGNRGGGFDLDATDGTLAAQYRRELIGRQENAKMAETTLEGILNGSVHLVDISTGHNLQFLEDNSYRGITGKFCKVDFALHKEDPTKYPMFTLLFRASADCHKGNEIYFDIGKISYLARQRDQEFEKGSNQGPKVLNVTAVAFHETRCGSTLVANSMIAMDPEKHRAYSESPPPVKAIHICGENFDRCSQKQAATIVKDVIYLMSRSDDHREERVFFKFQSITSKMIPTFLMAFPEVPWMYVYRDPVQVMMSHVKDDPSLRRTICTKSRRFPPEAVNEIAIRHGRRGASALDAIEYCAAHIAQLTEAGVRSLNDMAIPVRYDQLPSMMWETIMPKIFGRPMKQSEIDNLETISKSYSKGGFHKRKEGEFKGDSEQKEKKASDEVRKAAKEFLKESFDQLSAFEPKLLK